MGLKTWLGLKRSANDPVVGFHSDHYLRHNARRLEHLASLGLPIEGKSVLEVGAGIGDHTSFYLDRGCRVTVTEARDANLDVLRRRYEDVRKLDMENPKLDTGPFDICHCYGLLYHLANPATAIGFMGEKTSDMLFLETCVAFGDEMSVSPYQENANAPGDAISGMGCRPTRAWIFQELGKHFQHVYTTVTQPRHEEFPTDWSKPRDGISRAVFVASRQPLNNPLLATTLIHLHS